MRRIIATIASVLVILGVIALMALLLLLLDAQADILAGRGTVSNSMPAASTVVALGWRRTPSASVMPPPGVSTMMNGDHPQVSSVRNRHQGPRADTVASGLLLTALPPHRQKTPPAPPMDAQRTLPRVWSPRVPLRQLRRLPRRDPRTGASHSGRCWHETLPARTHSQTEDRGAGNE